MDIDDQPKPEYSHHHPASSSKAAETGSGDQKIKTVFPSFRRDIPVAIAETDVGPPRNSNGPPQPEGLKGYTYACAKCRHLFILFSDEVAAAIVRDSPDSNQGSALGLTADEINANKLVAKVLCRPCFLGLA